MVNRLLTLNVLFTYSPVAKAIRALAIATGKADAEAAEARSQLVRLPHGFRLGQHRQQGLSARAPRDPGLPWFQFEKALPLPRQGLFHFRTSWARLFAG